MGKATIISDQGEGLYTIQPEWNTTAAVARIATLTAENATIDTRLGTIDAEIASAEFDYNYATDVLSAAITNHAPEAEIETKQRDVLTKQSEWQGLKQTKSFLQLKKVANIKQIEFIQQQTATPAQIQSWCADYTEGLTGEVGTIELGRRDTTPIINPGGEDGTAAAYTALTDGQLVPLMSGSPSAAFVNYALLPGAAKWKARYRTGTASNINTDTDTMDVALDALTIAGINCNQAANLTDVPVEYMTCNATAFDNGDGVVVDFGQDWATPVVVGFVQEPTACLRMFCQLITRDDPASDLFTWRRFVISGPVYWSKNSFQIKNYFNGSANLTELRRRMTGRRLFFSTTSAEEEIDFPRAEVIPHTGTSLFLSDPTYLHAVRTDMSYWVFVDGAGDTVDLEEYDFAGALLRKISTAHIQVKSAAATSGGFAYVGLLEIEGASNKFYFVMVSDLGSVYSTTELTGAFAFYDLVIMSASENFYFLHMREYDAELEENYSSIHIFSALSGTRTQEIRLNFSTGEFYSIAGHDLWFAVVGFEDGGSGDPELFVYTREATSSPFTFLRKHPMPSGVTVASSIFCMWSDPDEEGI